MMQSSSRGRRIGIIGGSFDPIHIGHLVIAQDAAERLELSEVIFVPASVPPHKQHLQQATAEHRFNMVQLATENDMRFSVSDVELRRGGVSYTYDTISDLKQQFPSSELVLIVGSDTLADLPNWYRIEELLALCDVATILRPGEDDLVQIEKKITGLEGYRSGLMRNIIENRCLDISSTEVRMRVAEGLGIRYLVPPEVEMYIFEHGLYKG